MKIPLDMDRLRVFAPPDRCRWNAGLMAFPDATSAGQPAMPALGGLQSQPFFLINHRVVARRAAASAARRRAERGTDTAMDRGASTLLYYFK